MVKLNTGRWYKAKNGNVYGSMRRKVEDPDSGTFHIYGHGWEGLRWNENGEFLHFGTDGGRLAVTTVTREFFDLVEEVPNPTKDETPGVYVQKSTAADEDIFSAWKAGYNFAQSMKG